MDKSGVPIAERPNLLLKSTGRVNRFLGPEEDLIDILAKSIRLARRSKTCSSLRRFLLGWSEQDHFPALLWWNPLRCSFPEAAGRKLFARVLHESERGSPSCRKERA